MYARPDAGNGAVEFGVSGRLWRDTLIMFDRSSRSLWSQLTGEAIHGDRKGSALSKVPSIMTTWGEWLRQHPDTTALRKPLGIQGSAYADYFESDTRLGIHGTRLSDDRLAGKTLVFGLAGDERSVAVPLADGVRGAVRLKHEGQRVVVVRDGDRATAWAAVGDGELQYSDGVLTDRASERRWDAWTGRALSKETEALAAVPGVVNYWFTWIRFHPDSRIEGSVPRG